MARPRPLPVCDDVHGTHAWADPFTDGDTCCCGRFYLDAHPASGQVFEIQETPPPDSDPNPSETEVPR